MEFIFEVILQFLGEILLQIFFELLVELGLHSLADPVKKPRHPALSTIGFILWGAIAGGISLWMFPTSAIKNPDFRMLNLLVTPILIGGVMMMIGKFRNKKGQDLVSLDRFVYAFIFAFSMSLVRFIWAVHA
jgi:hypothetical protein